MMINYNSIDKSNSLIHNVSPKGKERCREKKALFLKRTPANRLENHQFVITNVTIDSGKEHQ